MIVAEIDNFGKARKAVLILCIVWIGLHNLNVDLTDIRIAGASFGISMQQAEITIMVSLCYCITFTMFYGVNAAKMYLKERQHLKAILDSELAEIAATANKENLEPPTLIETLHADESDRQYNLHVTSVEHRKLKISHEILIRQSALTDRFNQLIFLDTAPIVLLFGWVAIDSWRRLILS